MKSRREKKPEVKKAVPELKINETGEVSSTSVKTVEISEEEKTPETGNPAPTESIAPETENEENIPVAEVKVEEGNSSLVKSIILVIIGIFVGALTATAIIVLYKKMSEVKPTISQPPATVSVSPAESPEKPASDSGKITDDLALYDIKVLNGSGKGGEAGRTEKLLKDKGYSVLEIGNADKSDYKKTLIQAKKKVPQTFLDNLKKVLAEEFDLDTVGTLDDKEQTDIIIIVGSSPGAKPTAEPTKVLKDLPN